ncbi:hypothetical protein [Luteimonas salinilitoris]|uniref:Uncharacterized protein n=1 Tax=Luteimonas salinilitoris TaxID=3237697 RepID=A0ABV4HQ29_9GAMM
MAAGEQMGLALRQNEIHFYAVGLVNGERGTAVALYRRAGKADAPAGDLLASIDLPDSERPVSLRFRMVRLRLDVF